MTTTSKPPLAVGKKGADNLTAVLATDLVKTPKFKNLLKAVKNNIDRARVVYPIGCLLYTSPSPRDGLLSRMPSSA